MNQKRKLEESLATLLGFDLEDVSDVLDHLLTHDSSQDLMEYLTDFMGEKTQAMTMFVKNVEKFQRGEALDIMDADRNLDIDGLALDPQEGHHVKESQDVSSHSRKVPLQTISSSSSAPTANAQSTKKKSANLTKQQQRQQQQQRPVVGTIQAKQSFKSSTKASSKSKPQQQRPNSKSKAAPSKRTELEQDTLQLSIDDKTHTKTTSTMTQVPPTPTPPPPPQPLIGKASVICGCYGTIYKALTNCLHCGRIICEKEGYGYCPFCGHWVPNISSSMMTTAATGGTLDPAWVHKERLLQFDRENAQRTVVLDEAADDYENSNSMWLTREEQVEAKTKDDNERVERDLVKKKNTFNLVI